jgi:multicomponent Na+:H+ antiporter subunit F
MKYLKYIFGLILIIAFLILNFVIKIDLILRFINPMILCISMCLYRILLGPTPADRSVAVDILGLVVVGVCGILSVFNKVGFFIDIGIAWALQSFIGTLALAKYLEGKKLDE